MNKSLVSLLCLFVLLIGVFTISAQVEKPVQWQEFVSTEGRFRLLFPNTPRRLVTKVERPEANFDHYRFVAGTKNFSFEITYADYPNYPLEMTEDERRDVYNEVHNSMFFKAPQVSIINDHDFLHDGKTGRDLTITTGDGITVRYRIWISGIRFYQLAVGYRTALQNNTSTQRKVEHFLNSFQVISYQKGDFLGQSVYKSGISRKENGL
jgi:hypothetical protein